MRRRRGWAGVETKGVVWSITILVLLSVLADICVSTEGESGVCALCSMVLTG